MAQQLVQLIKGSCKLDRRLEANEVDLEIAKRAAFDSIPAVRRKLIDQFIEKEIVNHTFIDPKSTRFYAFQDLRSLGLVGDAKLSELGASLLTEAGVEFTTSPAK